MVIVLKIELLEVSKPKLWREIKVSPEISFHQLHLIIKAAFGWRDSHLYQFSENGYRDLISICSPYDEEGAVNATEISASSILYKMCNSYSFEPKDALKLKYIYDYGDSWEHEITAVRFDSSSEKTELVDGGGACPPEDCGGVHGFEDLKSSLKTGKPSAIHGESWIPWLEGCGYEDFDPERFDLKAGKKRVRKVR